MPVQWTQLLSNRSKDCAFNLLNAICMLYSSLRTQRKGKDEENAKGGGRAGSEGIHHLIILSWENYDLNTFVSTLYTSQLYHGPHAYTSSALYPDSLVSCSTILLFLFASAILAVCQSF